MAIIIETVKFKNLKLGDTSFTDWFQGNVMDRLQVEIEFRVETFYTIQSILADDGLNSAQVNPSVVNTAHPSGANQIWADDPIAFEDFDVGDKVKITNPGVAANGTERTIIEKIGDDHLVMDIPYVDQPLTSNFLEPNAIVYVSTPIKSMEFFHNQIENNEGLNFTSKIDGSTIQAIGTDLGNFDFTQTVFTQMGKKSYQFGFVQIIGSAKGNPQIGITDVSQAFRITHEMVIGPWFLAKDIADRKNGIFPDDFKDGNCLKYVFRIEASEDVKNPNKKKTVIEFEVLGNTGYLGENFNQGPTNYSFDTVLYKNGATIIDAFELTTSEITLDFFIKNTTDIPFSDGNTNFDIAFSLLPQPEDEYRAPEFAIQPVTTDNKLLKTNFLLDFIVVTLGNLSTDPVNLGTDDQVIKDATVIFISTSRVKVTITFKLAQAAVDRISAMASKDYSITISTQNHTKLRADSDGVRLDIDLNEFFINTTDPDMMSIDLSFIDHTGSVVGVDNKDTMFAFVEDDIVGIAEIILDQNGREDDVIELTSITSEIIVTDGTTVQVLDDINEDLTGSQIILGIPFVDVTQDRGFQTPADDLRRDFRILRDTTLDGGGFFRYRVLFPWVHKWMSWEFLDKVDGIFFDATKENNGQNNNWVRYPTFPGWDIFLRVTINATKNGEAQQYREVSIIQNGDYTEGVNWNSENFKITDKDTGDDLGTLYQRFKDSLVTSNLTFIGGVAPALNDLVVVLKANVFQEGNELQQFTIDNLYPRHPNTRWISPNGVDNVVLTKLGSIFSWEALFEGLKFQSGDIVKFSARLYDTRPETPFPPGSAKLLSQGGFKKRSNNAGFKILS